MYVRPAVVRKGRLVLEANLPFPLAYDREIVRRTIHYGRGFRASVAPIDDDIYNVYFILRGRETIKVRGVGTVKTIRFSVKLISGNVFTGEEDLSVWISDDENRIPVLFEAPILVGVASGRITDWSGLKHPFTALIKKR